MACEHAGAATHVSRLLFTASRKTKCTQTQIPQRRPGGGLGGVLGRRETQTGAANTVTAGACACTIFKKIWETPLTSTIHPSTRPHLLLSTTSELFTRQTAPKGKATKLTASAHPDSGSVCVYPCQAAGPNRCDQSNQASTCCLLCEPSCYGSKHTQTHTQRKGLTEEPFVCLMFAC